MYLLNGGAPFTKDKKTGRVRDRTGEEVTLYPAAREALLELATSKEWQGSLVCYASRCHETDWAHTCMDLLDVGDGLNVASCFNAGGVFQSGSKQGHFQVLASQHGVDFEDMIFFDNERWNITEVAKMGVTWYVLSLSLSLSSAQSTLSLTFHPPIRLSQRVHPKRAQEGPVREGPAGPRKQEVSFFLLLGLQVGLTRQRRRLGISSFCTKPQFIQLKNDHFISCHR